ncbi:MAG: AAA family ATPase [Erysipelotrichaceae bacterium]|nr:AAA family ATPase [Erysipelotrichaceae bacterium]
MNKPMIIILRGNSGSGKTTIGRILQQYYGSNTMLICQDIIRRQLLRVKDGENCPAIDMLINLVEYGYKHNNVVILEGILRNEWYAPLFDKIVELYQNNIYAYYFELSFDETVRRHALRSQHSEFGRKELQKWFKPHNYIYTIEEKLIYEDESVDQILHNIFFDINNGLNSKVKEIN